MHFCSIDISDLCEWLQLGSEPSLNDSNTHSLFNLELNSLGSFTSAYQTVQECDQCVIYKNTSKIGAVIITGAGPSWRGWGQGGS